MIRTLTILAAVAAIAGPASAADITVSLAGKDTATIRADIKRAARAVCREANVGPLAFYQTSQCVADTIKDAETKIEDVLATAPASDQLALAR